MTISVVTSVYGYRQFSGVAGRGGFSIPTPTAPTDRVPGDLMIAVVGSSAHITSYSAGWAEIASAGSGSVWVAAYRKVAEGNDNDFLTVSPAASCTWGIGHALLRSTVGFDENSVKASSLNTASGAGASYALSSSPGSVASGEVAIALGGDHNSTNYLNNYFTLTGTNWTNQFTGGYQFPVVPGYGGAAMASNTTVGAVAVPSVSYNDTTHTFGRFIFAAIIKEGVAGGMPGGGLFWGAP